MTEKIETWLKEKSKTSNRDEEVTVKPVVKKRRKRKKDGNTKEVGKSKN